MLQWQIKCLMYRFVTVENTCTCNSNLHDLEGKIMIIKSQVVATDWHNTLHGLVDKYVNGYLSYS